MVTLVIRLSSGPWTWQEATEQTVKAFPGEIALFSSDSAEGVRIKLNQERLTDEQRDWLFAREHVESYHVEGAKPPTAREFKLTARNMELSHENQQLRAQLDKAYNLLSNMPTHLDQDDSMTHLWIETRNKWLHEQIVSAQPERKLSDVPLDEYLTS